MPLIPVVLVGSLLYSLCFLFACAIATKLNRCSPAASWYSCATSRCTRTASRCPRVFSRCSCATSFLTLDVVSTDTLLLWSEILIPCQRKSKWDHIGIPRIPGWPPLDTVKPDVKHQFVAQERP